jgi:hypothetical protein
MYQFIVTFVYPLRHRSVYCNLCLSITSSFSLYVNTLRVITCFIYKHVQPSHHRSRYKHVHVIVQFMVSVYGLVYFIKLIQ